MIGETIGQYEIVAELGSGGMGVVYRARDTRLDRSVAIKVLGAQRTADPERRARFMQEARSASALNHPNIVTIYEINRHRGVDYIAMEYVAGSTLDELIPRGRGMRITEVLRYAIQIADALTVAHAAGIVHRDLKPNNVMVTPEGRVKVLDFGLAKLTDPDQMRDESQETLTCVLRDDYVDTSGMVVGTAAYMSPEQAEGRKVDARSDIFSFGALLYEMVTGQRAFQAESAAGTMAAVLRDEPPPVGEVSGSVPVELERLIHRCLRKDVHQRAQHVDDIRVELEELKQDSDSGQLRPVVEARKAAGPTPVSAWLVGLMAVSAVAAIGGWLVGAASRHEGFSSVVPGGVTLSRVAGGGEATSPSWSPDGRWIVYISDRSGNMDIWKQPSRGGEAIQLTNSPLDEQTPAWSPDGRSIAYAVNGGSRGIYLIPEAGGIPVLVAGFGTQPRWSPDGRTLAFDHNGDIYLVPSAGGQPVPVVTGTSTEPHPEFSPDGRRLIYWDRTKGDVFLADVENPHPAALGLVPAGEEISGLSWSDDGRWLIYGRGSFGGNKDLWRVRLNPATGQLAGAPLRLTLSATDDGDCRFSPDGHSVVYTVRHTERHLWRLDRSPKTGLSTGLARRLTRNGQLNYYPVVSRDGKTLLWTSHASGRGHLYYERLDGDKPHKLTTDWQYSNREAGADFSPDGRQVVFSSTLGGSYQIWRLPSLGSVSLQMTVTSQPVRDTHPVWSPDGGTILFYSNRSGNWDLWAIDPAGGKPRQITDWESNETYPMYSPDGRRVAFLTDREGNPDLWTLDLETGDSQPIVRHPAEEGWPAWSPDGRFFYFTSNRGGDFGIWMMPASGGDPVQIEMLVGPAARMPVSALFTKFAVTTDSFIVPLEARSSDIYVLDGLTD